MGLIGHNRGPSLDGGGGWRRHCWRVAREALLPNLPIEVVRLQVKRARDLGLPYKTYAGIRAQTGHDVVAFLFSSNGLRAGVVQPVVARDVAAKLDALRAVLRIGLATAPLAPSALAQNTCLDRTAAAPHALAPARQTAQTLREILHKIPADRVILVGIGDLERDWVSTARLAGWVAADHYFSA